jgi:hypothetical protein
VRREIALRLVGGVHSDGAIGPGGSFVPEILTQYSEIWSFLGGLISGGIGGSLLTLRYTRQNRVTGRGSIVDQSRSKAAGDIVGGSKRT